MDFIYEKDVMRLETHEDTCQITGFIEHGSGSHLESDPEFIGYNIGKGCLAKSGWAVEQGIICILYTSHSKRDAH